MEIEISVGSDWIFSIINNRLISEWFVSLRIFSDKFRDEFGADAEYWCLILTDLMLSCLGIWNLFVHAAVQKIR